MSESRGNGGWYAYLKFETQCHSKTSNLRLANLAEEVITKMFEFEKVGVAGRWLVDLESAHNAQSRC